MQPLRFTHWVTHYPLGAYFLSNSRHSTDRRYIITGKVPLFLQQIKNNWVKFLYRAGVCHFMLWEMAACVSVWMHTLCKDSRITWPHFVPQKTSCLFATNWFQVVLVKCWSGENQFTRKSSTLHVLPSDRSPLTKHIHRLCISMCVGYVTIGYLNDLLNLSVQVHPYSKCCLFWTIVHVYNTQFKSACTCVISKPV